MSISPLVPIAGAALGSIAARTLEKLSNAPSFLDVLQGNRLENGLNSARSASDDSELSQDNLERLSELQAEMNSLARRLRQRFAAAGINMSSPIELKSDGRGGVIVDDPHPHRAAIEQLVANDPDLNASFQFLAAAFSAEDIMRASADDRSHGEFRLRLEQDTTQAVFE